MKWKSDLKDLNNVLKDKKGYIAFCRRWRKVFEYVLLLQKNRRQNEEKNNLDKYERGLREIQY